jgi:hypothetical protein
MCRGFGAAWDAAGAAPSPLARRPLYPTLSRAGRPASANPPQCEAHGNTADLAASPFAVAFTSKTTSVQSLTPSGKTVVTNGEPVTYNHFCYRVTDTGGCKPDGMCADALANAAQGKGAGKPTGRRRAGAHGSS